ncbi:hypothetical protein N7501_002585 [Penicillium viridicatum]|nr:hypothetical protein N7501_002585 [Penicillium viridicatum]
MFNVFKYARQWSFINRSKCVEESATNSDEQRQTATNSGEDCHEEINTRGSSVSFAMLMSVDEC